jgi:hypothetical protein
VVALSVVALELSQEGGPAEAVPGVTDPVPHSINNVLIDMDPYGTPANPDNGPGLLGSTETCNAVPVGGSLDIDIVVDEVDPSDLMKAFQVTLQYAGAGPGAVNVTGVNASLMLGCVWISSDPTPDNGDGSFMAGSMDMCPPGESGEGVLARVTLTGVGPAGMSWLDFKYDPIVIAAIGPLTNLAIPISNTEGAVVAVGDVNGDTAVDNSDCNVPDGDGDGMGDPVDNCSSIPNRWQENTDGDPYGDVCDNCPAVATVWVVPPGDSDCDGFTDTEEAFVATDPADACPDDLDDDCWPADLSSPDGYGKHDGTVNILDVVQLTPPVFGASPPDPNYNERKDLNGDGTINILDIVKVTPPVFGTSCTP